MMLDQKTIAVNQYHSLRHINQSEWNLPIFSQPLLDYELLDIIEEAHVNNLQHFYFQLLNSQKSVIGRANAYIALTDFATLESGMSPAVIKVIQGVKKLFPGFLAFNMLECGFFTTLGEGVEACEPQYKPAAIQAVAQEMEKLTKSHKVDFLFFRDIPLEAYETYKQILMPMGYLPTLGFPNAVLELAQDNFAAFLQTFNSKERLKLKNSLLFKEKFNIECKIIKDYEHLSPELAKLWKNVYQGSKDYSREFLDEQFFYTCSQVLKEQSEVITFWSEGQLIAFMLNLFNRDEYFVLDWGVDYEFQYYRQANLYRAASLLSIDQAIKHNKKRVAFGITNYIPKKLVNATIHPLVYFVKHLNNPLLTYALAAGMKGQIVQPDFGDFWQLHPQLHQYQELDNFIAQEQSSFFQQKFSLKIPKRKF
ncbi:peptidogalycan biosysnthesis protein [Nostoc sp.]|uniref:peptidogalycan biosysnthesis protein n=1 Tax=Nostoc sp. TaxID=1180 RepID=UPI002FFC0833